MLVFVLPVLAGAAGALLRGGDFSPRSELRLRRPAIIVLGLATQASLVHVAPRWRLPLLLLTTAVAGAWIALNVVHRSRGMQVALAVVAAGWALNVAVIAPNGGMPVSARALEGIGVPTGYDVREGHFSKHRFIDPSTRLGWLGDTIAVPPLRAVISIGDIVLAVGIATLTAMVMGGRADDEAAAVERRPGALVSG